MIQVIQNYVLIDHLCASWEKCEEGKSTVGDNNNTAKGENYREDFDEWGFFLQYKYR